MLLAHTTTTPSKPPTNAQPTTNQLTNPYDVGRGSIHWLIGTTNAVQALSKAEKEWTKRLGSERHLVGIEDPFELSHDLGRTIDRFTVTTLRREFERAADILAHEPRPLQLLFQRRE